MNGSFLNNVYELDPPLENFPSFTPFGCILVRLEGKPTQNSIWFDHSYNLPVHKWGPVIHSVLEVRKK